MISKGCVAIALGMVALTLPALAEMRTGAPNAPLEMRAGTAATLRSDRPISRVVLGNSALLDALPQTDRVLGLVAKAPGVTNIILLDDVGAEIYANEVVISARAATGGVMVHGASGAGRARDINTYHNYRCSPVCSYGGTVGIAKLSPVTGEEIVDQTVYTITNVTPPAQQPQPPAPPRR